MFSPGMKAGLIYSKRAPFKTMNLQSLTYLEKTGSASEREGKTSLNALANKHMGALAALP